jgi:putative sterol carrier protein
MALMEVPEDITVDNFFQNYAVKQFEEAKSQADLSFLDGKEFSMQFDVDGKKYCLNIKDGKEMEVIEGGVDKPMLCISVNENLWRGSITGKIDSGMDQFTDASQMADAARYNTMLSTKGTLNAELKTDDGVENFKMVFNAEDAPSVTLKLAMSDWAAIQKKEADGQSLFMSGKMEFDGDMMFLMSLQALMS